MLFWWGLLVSPSPSDLSQEQIELIHKVAVLADEYHQDPALALRIIKCEGGLRYDAVGKNYINGEVWSRDKGPWQINDYYHYKTALSRGFDIHEPNQNLEYGMMMLKEEGTAPWKASQNCWSRSKNITPQIW